MSTTLLRIVILASLAYGTPALSRELPPLQTTVNDLAGMIPPASDEDLTRRLKRFKTQSGHTVSVLTVASLEENESIQALAAEAFGSLPLDENELEKTVLVVVARKEHLVGFKAGAELRPRFPAAQARQKLQSHLDLYINGLRPDLGIYGGVHFIFGVISGEFRVASTTEEEALENASIRGAGAGAIFALFLAPFLAFIVSLVLGLYSKHAGFQRETRLFLGVVMGGGTAQLVAALMGMISPYSNTLWYFI
ncbi:MAG: TPM domain-containing protein, partial [Candidatus Binatia bacterium]